MTLTSPGVPEPGRKWSRFSTLLRGDGWFEEDGSSSGIRSNPHARAGRPSTAICERERAGRGLAESRHHDSVACSRQPACPIVVCAPNAVRWGDLAASSLRWILAPLCEALRVSWAEFARSDPPSQECHQQKFLPNEVEVSDPPAARNYVSFPTRRQRRRTALGRFVQVSRAPGVGSARGDGRSGRLRGSHT